MKVYPSYEVASQAIGTALRVGFGVGVASLVLGTIAGVNGTRASIEQTIDDVRSDITASLNQESQFLGEQPQECETLIRQIELQEANWRKAADAVGRSGLCGAGSDGVVSKAYTFHDAQLHLNEDLNANEVKLADWGNQVLNNMFTLGLGGGVAGGVGTGMATYYGLVRMLSRRR